jgi:predicted RNA-binding Zn ribbon-like protein
MNVNKFGIQREMTGNRPPPLFVADAPGLDFVNSFATPSGRKMEWLTDGEDLLAWLQKARMVPDETVTAMRANALPGELDNVTAQARELREWFRSFVLRHKGAPLRKDALGDLSPLNALLERDELYRPIGVRHVEHVHDGNHSEHAVSGFERLSSRRWRAPASLLLPIADAMADLVCSAHFTLVRKCEGLTCTIVFLDTTQGQARRWCSMAACGNRAKQAAHRERAKHRPSELGSEVI